MPFVPDFSLSAIVLAGGRGTRLEPLTSQRAKPAVPFGGGYRLIDFTLSNCLNSGIRNLFVVSQYKSRSLERHLNLGWRPLFAPHRGEHFEILPPQQRINNEWYQGTADAVYQNIYSLERFASDYTLVLGGDHIYQMDYRKMVAFHQEKGADLTIATLPVPVKEASQFGVMAIDNNSRICQFQEKPEYPATLPNDKQTALVSMGIYIFGSNDLYTRLCQDALNSQSHHDFGKNIIPEMVQTANVYAYPFTNELPKVSNSTTEGYRRHHIGPAEPRMADPSQSQKTTAGYWRDVGTLDAYYEANMDLLRPYSAIDLASADWPLYTHAPCSLPSYVSPASEVGALRQSLLSPGCRIQNALIENSIIGPNVTIEPGAHVSDSILCDGAHVKEGSRVHRAILDRQTIVDEGAEFHAATLQMDSACTISDLGIAVLAKNQVYRKTSCNFSLNFEIPLPEEKGLQSEAKTTTKTISSKDMEKPVVERPAGNRENFINLAFTGQR
ncbi:MAG: glucose-1-phosphate adenylyltransferase [Pirellulaceae bacterium]|nr:glucose-1-phosphate adenylyltransferase [Pirellulaceae bacterium]